MRKLSKMKRYIWSHLNNLQVGKYTEYFVKMELTMYGFEVYSTEVDDRGIDFVARRDGGPFVEVQVKSRRGSEYVFMRKSEFELRDNLYLAFGLLRESKPPALYLIPSRVWESPNALFVSRDYAGLESAPEWGMNVSQKNMPLLNSFRFKTTVNKLCATPLRH
jgi:hypothetical protein